MGCASEATLLRRRQREVVALDVSVGRRKAAKLILAAFPFLLLCPVRNFVVVVAIAAHEEESHQTKAHRWPPGHPPTATASPMCPMPPPRPPHFVPLRPIVPCAVE